MILVSNFQCRYLMIANKNPSSRLTTNIYVARGFPEQLKHRRIAFNIPRVIISELGPNKSFTNSSQGNTKIILIFVIFVVTKKQKRRCQGCGRSCVNIRLSLVIYRSTRISEVPEGRQAIISTQRFGLSDSENETAIGMPLASPFAISGSIFSRLDRAKNE